MNFKTQKFDGAASKLANESLQNICSIITMVTGIRESFFMLTIARSSSYLSLSSSTILSITDSAMKKAASKLAELILLCRSLAK